MPLGNMDSLYFVSELVEVFSMVFTKIGCKDTISLSLQAEIINVESQRLVEKQSLCAGFILF